MFNERTTEVNSFWSLRVNFDGVKEEKDDGGGANARLITTAGDWHIKPCFDGEAMPRDGLILAVCRPAALTQEQASKSPLTLPLIRICGNLARSAGAGLGAGGLLIRRPAGRDDERSHARNVVAVGEKTWRARQAATSILFGMARGTSSLILPRFAHRVSLPHSSWSLSSSSSSSSLISHLCEP